MKKQIYPVRSPHQRGDSRFWRLSSNGVYRILDANANRAREGLRVLEDIARFIYDDKKITSRLKRERHSITVLLKGLPWGDKLLLKCRDSVSDVGAKSHTFGEGKRDGIMEIVISNFRRCEEAIRVLEEFSKIFKDTISRRFKAMRFRLYTLEKKFGNE